MSYETKILAAAVLGTAAFKDGKKCVPALDMKNISPLLAGNSFGDAIPILKMWSRAWCMERDRMMASWKF